MSQFHRTEFIENNEEAAIGDGRQYAGFEKFESAPCPLSQKHAVVDEENGAVRLYICHISYHARETRAAIP
jgi:hypothetical protein